MTAINTEPMLGLIYISESISQAFHELPMEVRCYVNPAAQIKVTMKRSTQHPVPTGSGCLYCNQKSLIRIDQTKLIVAVNTPKNVNIAFWSVIYHLKTQEQEVEITAVEMYLMLQVWGYQIRNNGRLIFCQAVVFIVLASDKYGNVWSLSDTRK